MIVLWDTILANDIIDSTLFTDSYNLIFIDFLAVAMIVYIREDRNYFCLYFMLSFKKRSK